MADFESIEVREILLEIEQRDKREAQAKLYEASNDGKHKLNCMRH